VQNHLSSNSKSVALLEVYVKIKKIERNVLLAMCDAEILGETLREGKLVFCVREDFYKGARVSVEEAVSMIEKSTIVNMVGRNIVRKAVEKGYVHPEAILTIQGVPHAQVVKL
jgi:hypothetical protein